MATVFDVAKYILRKCGRISTWKLEKLCYYSQAWTMAWDEIPLFDEEFEAWANGPVCPELFKEHKGMFSITEDLLEKGSIDNLNEEQINNIDIVLDTYGDKEAFWLREQTHEEPPWQIARGDTPEGESCQNIITKDSMGEYYGSL